jgi:hypothetical protein
MPVTVAHLGSPACRVDDVGEEYGRENPIIGHFCVLPGEELGDLLEDARHPGSTTWYMLRPNAGLNQRRAARARDTSGRALSTVILARASTR